MLVIKPEIHQWQKSHRSQSDRVATKPNLTLRKREMAPFLYEMLHSVCRDTAADVSSYCFTNTRTINHPDMKLTA